MARLAHLSDLHFGAHDARLVSSVERKIDALKQQIDSGAYKVDSKIVAQRLLDKLA